MPRGRRTDILSSFRAQAARALDMLQGEIREREAEIRHMVAQADGWRALIGGGPARRGPGQPRKATGARGGGKRVDWDEVLASVPKQFGIEDVMKHPGAASKGRAQAYPALTRWETSGRIKRIEKGRYEKVGNGAAAKPKRARKQPAKKK